MGKQKIIAVVGPTASGKTALSVALAKRFGGQVISGDSMQVYRNMTIGTAKPSLCEQDGIPHHLMDFLSPEEPFSVAQYTELATKTAEKLQREGALPFVVGGTGLYIDSFLSGNRFESLEENPAVREKLMKEVQEGGGKALWDRLFSCDPESAAAIHENNTIRLVRAMEVYETTGRPLSDFKKKSRPTEAPYEVCWLGLCTSEREILYARIEKRVDEMMACGLLDEARTLRETYRLSKTAANAIGYKELFSYLDGDVPLDEAVEQVKQGSRRYAKRQLTWFKRNSEIHWLTVDDSAQQMEAEEQAARLIEIFLEQ